MLRAAQLYSLEHIYNFLHRKLQTSGQLLMLYMVCHFFLMLYVYDNRENRKYKSSPVILRL